MQRLSRKTIIVLLVGGGMVLVGAALSLLHDRGEIGVVSNLAIIFGLLIAGFSGFNSRWNGTVHRDGPGLSAKSGLVDKVELCAYAAAVLMFIVLAVAAGRGIFSNVLTFAFLATLIVATVFWFWRRVFG